MKNHEACQVRLSIHETWVRIASSFTRKNGETYLQAENKKYQ